MYMCTTEVGVLFTLILYSPTGRLEVVRGCFLEICMGNVHFTYTNSQTVPSFSFPDDVATAASKMLFWTVGNDYFSARGPMAPVRLFRHSFRHCIVVRRKVSMQPHSSAQNYMEKART